MQGIFLEGFELLLVPYFQKYLYLSERYITLKSLDPLLIVRLFFNLYGLVIIPAKPINHQDYQYR